LLVPIADDFTYLDLVLRLSLPVVVVVGSRLGCVNHALLTLKTLANTGARTLGYVLNTIAADAVDTPSAESNREMIAAFSKATCLGIFPHVPADRRHDDEYLARLAETSLDLDALAT
jgi:dethiobiotin synthetase